MACKTFLGRSRSPGSVLLTALLLGAATLPGGGADAQSTRPAPADAGKAVPGAKSAPAVAAEPAATTATFGDWVLRCQVVGLPAGAEPARTWRLCEVGQSMQIEGQPAPIAQIAIGRASQAGPLLLTVVLPTNVSFASGVRVVTGSADAASDTVDSAAELGWRRCQPGACFADAIADTVRLAEWRAAAEPGRILFNDATGRELAIPVSFRGLAQALDALEQ